MSSASVGMHRSLELPWTQSEEQERRYRRIQLRVLIVLLLLCLLMLLLPAPPLPPTLAPPPPTIEIVLDQRPLPPPLPPAPPAPTPKAEVAAATPAPTVKPKPQAVEKPAEVRDSKSGSAPPGPTARERAQAAGLGALANDLADLRNSSVASKAITGRPDLTGKPNPNYTSDLNGGTDKGPGSERSLITAQAGVASGGINTAAFSRGVGGGGLAGRGTTQVEGYGGGGNGKGPGVGRGGNGSGGNGSGGGGNGTGSGSGNGTGSGSGGSRSREEIERIFDQNKGAIYALYNRALRETPGLQGKMVLELTILPNGTVSACKVVTSELHDAELERRLVQRVLLFKFEARDVATVTTTKPIDFFPNS
jgi:TonB family protein